MWFLKDKKHLFVCVIFLFFFTQLRSQQFTQFSSYLLNSMGINSAYTGSNDATEFLANYRKQWITLPGSPQTVFLSGNGYFEKRKVGIGGVLLSDKIGGANSVNLTLNGSYRLPLGKFALQFGLNAGTLFYRQNLDDLKVVDSGDKVFSGESVTQVLPVLGTGVYLFSNDFYLGLSSPDLLETENINKKRHFYFSVGKVLSLNNNLKIKPAVLAKYVQSTRVQFDLSTTMIVRDVYGAGASLRTGAGFVIFGQVFPSENLAIALAYDKMTNGLLRSEAGTIELTAIYTISSKRAIIYNPRYF